MAEYYERKEAVDALNKALFAYEDETEARFKNDPELDISEWFFHRIFVQHNCGFLRSRWNHGADRMVDDDDFCKWGRKREES